jgi:hypothetical protein
MGFWALTKGLAGAHVVRSRSSLRVLRSFQRGILRDARQSSIDFGVFYTKRCFRIVPIFSVMLRFFPVAAVAVRSAYAGGLALLFANPIQ